MDMAKGNTPRLPDPPAELADRPGPGQYSRPPLPLGNAFASKGPTSSMQASAKRWSGEPEFPETGFSHERREFPGPGSHQPNFSNRASGPAALILAGEPRFPEPSQFASGPGPAYYGPRPFPPEPTAVSMRLMDGVPRFPEPPEAYNVPGVGAYNVKYDEMIPSKIKGKVSFDQRKRDVCTSMEVLRSASAFDPGPGSYNLQISEEVCYGLRGHNANRGTFVHI